MSASVLLIDQASLSGIILGSFTLTSNSAKHPALLPSKCIQNLTSQHFYCYLQPSLPALQICCLHTSQEVRNICLFCLLIIALSPFSAHKEFKKCLLHEMIHFGAERFV